MVEVVKGVESINVGGVGAGCLKKFSGVWKAVTTSKVEGLLKDLSSSGKGVGVKIGRITGCRVGFSLG